MRVVFTKVAHLEENGTTGLIRLATDGKNLELGPAQLSFNYDDKRKVSIFFGYQLTTIMSKVQCKPTLHERSENLLGSDLANFA